MKKILEILFVFILLTPLTGKAQISPNPSPVQKLTGLNGAVTAMTVYDGKLIIGGKFTEADGMPCRGLVAWDGTSFDTLPGTPPFIESTNSTNGIFALTQAENSLYVGGSFQNLNTPSGIVNFGNMARYTGIDWQRMVSTPSTAHGATNGPVRSLQSHGSLLYVGGDFTMVDVNAGVHAGHLATWNWNFGPGWEALGNTGLSGNSPSCHAMTIWNDRLVIAGRFSAADNIQSTNMVIWDDVIRFISINTGSVTQSTGSVQCIDTLAGKIYAGGNYSNIGKNLLFGLNAYDGSGWTKLNADLGIDRRALYACSEGYIWVGGHIEELGSNIRYLFIYNVAQNSIMPFSNAYWGVNGIVNAIVEYNGELYIGGEFDKLLGNNHPDITFNNIFKVSNFCGSTMSVNTTDKVNNILVYPNPATDMLYFHSESSALIQQVSIHDITGRQLYTPNIFGEIPMIDISQLKAGVYFITLYVGNERIVKKFVKH